MQTAIRSTNILPARLYRHLRPLPGTGDRLISEHELERFLRSTRDESEKRQKSAV